MGYPIHHPLREINALRTYRWPDPDDPRIYEPIYRQAEGRLDADTFLCGSHRNLLLEKAEKLVGMEDLLLYFYTEPEFVRELLHRYMDFQLGIARHYLALGIEMISCSEDLGTQSSTLIGPALWREFLLPEYKRLLEPYKQRGIIIEFHSCGHIRPFVEPLMELGVDILNPVQATANDLNELRQVTQGRMALHGGVRSDLILNGPTEAIEREAWTRMWQLGREGGYFCDQDQHMNFPPSHRAALRKAVDQHGWYPLIEPAFT